MVVRSILAITYRLPGVIDAECFTANAAIQRSKGFDSTVFRIDERAEVTVCVLAIPSHLIGTVYGAGRIHLAPQRPDLGRGPATLRVEKRLIGIPLEIVADHVPVVVQAERRA